MKIPREGNWVLFSYSNLEKISALSILWRLKTYDEQLNINRIGILVLGKMNIDSTIKLTYFFQFFAQKSVLEDLFRFIEER